MSSTFSIDHIVIMVQNLDQARQGFDDLGFTVLSGGTHAANPTHNALISFKDGAYIEIIALQPGKEDHPRSKRLDKWVAASPGLVDFALLPTHIEADIIAARERGLDIEDAQDGGRLRPDGQAIQWQTANLGGSGLPFLCGDVTERRLRVPDGEAQHHKNGVTGVSNITIAVENLLTSAKYYEALLGIPPRPTPQNAALQAKTTTFSLNTVSITLAQPLAEASPLQSYLKQGERPYSFTLRSEHIQTDQELPLSQASQAHIGLTSINPSKK
ncbi:MAG: VOC family protein [Chloroflexota bacterium]